MTVMSALVKSVAGSLSVKVMVAVSPTFRTVSSVVISIVGGTVSTAVRTISNVLTSSVPLPSVTV